MEGVLELVGNSKQPVGTKRLLSTSSLN